MKSNVSDRSPEITKMILQALPRTMANAFEMGPNVLRWELKTYHLPKARNDIEKAFSENRFVSRFTVKQETLTKNQLFIEVTYDRIDTVSE